MKNLVLVGIILLFVGQFHSASACSESEIAGTFTGYIYGGGPDSTTTFEVDSGGNLTGYYFMSSYNEDGELDNLVLADNVLTGNWKDTGGTGTIEFLFAEDCLSFSGKWRGGGHASHQWDGEK